MPVAIKRAIKEEENDSASNSSSEHEGVLKQVFIDSDRLAIGFYIHPSVTDPFTIGNLTSDIKRHGGFIQRNEEHVDTVIVDDMKVDRDALQLSYELHRRHSKRDIWVEPISFIRRCIREGVLRHRVRQRQGMGGTVEKTPFTEKDDTNLCRYLALRIPDKAAGGRFGNHVYQQLESMGKARIEPNSYTWARRHPWQSWRERYKKNAQRLDYLIAQFAEIDPPTQRQLYHRDRRIGQGKLPLEDSSSASSDVEIVETRIRGGNPTGVDDSHRKKRHRGETKQTSRRAPQLFMEHDRDRNEGPSFHDSLFSEGELEELEMKQNHPDSDEHEHIANNTHLSLATFPATSQMTLVDNDPQTVAEPMPPVYSEKKFSSLPPARSPSGSARIPVLEVGGHTDGIHLPTHEPPSTPNQPIPAAPIPPNDQQTVESLMPTVSHKRKLIGVKKARRPMEPVSLESVAVADPPFLNTRSRSRSAEPTTSSKKVKEKTKQRLVLKPVKEQANEESLLITNTHDNSATVSGETLGDEMDVERILFTGATDIEQSHFENKPLDADDRQTDDILHKVANESSSQQHPTSSFELDASPEDVLRAFMDALPATSISRSSQRSSVRTSVVPRQNRKDEKQRGTLATRPTQISDDVFTTQLRTPVLPRLRSRLNSTSSVETFPVAGTKANAVKKKMEAEEKHSPYRPPAGTRAALIR